MGIKLRKLLISEWPPSTWHRQAHGAAKEPRWEDPDGEARLRDVVADSNGVLMLIVSDAQGREWANTVELADAGAMPIVSRTLAGALGKRVADVAGIELATSRSDLEVAPPAAQPSLRSPSATTSGGDDTSGT
jgi:hypothetical protein